MQGENFYKLKHFAVTVAVVLLWLRKGYSCHIFLAENKVYWSVSVYVRKGGVCITLITKIKATEICCFVPKEQIPKYTFSMHWKCFHASNYTEEVIKMSISYLKNPERTNRQQATETAAVLPWFPSFNFQGAAGAMPTQQRAQGITSSHSGQLLRWGGN